MYEDQYDYVEQLSFEKKNNDNEFINVPEPTGLRISTMTAVASLSTPINLPVIGKYLKTCYDEDPPNIKNKIEYMAHGDIKRGVHPKGNKKSKSKKPFYNQATVIIKLDSNKFVNVKIFVNGNLQVTGLKSISDGKLIFDSLINELNKTHGIMVKKNEKNENIEVFEKAIENPENIVIKDFEVMLINSDYFCGYKIERETLYKIMIKEYGLFSTFEPCIYPGVNIKYYWNSENRDISFPGVCQCSTKCNGKGDGHGNGNCKKITISAFQSGNVIITGARNEEQIKITYNFINSIFKKYYSDLKKNDIPDFEDLYFSDDSDNEISEKKKRKQKQKIVMVKKSKIKKPNSINKYIENPLLS